MSTKWVDISSVVAASAALWALCFAWVTYVASVLQKNDDEFQALKSIVDGLHIELELMKDWTGAGGQGYSKDMAIFPPDWSEPGRLIYKFDVEAISKLTSSPFLYRLGSIVEPFARLNFSVSRLFQLYDEYRSFVNSDPGIYFNSHSQGGYRQMIFDFNRRMHIYMIGGADSDNPNCLYKAYGAATSALKTFQTGLSRRKLPCFFWVGHVISFVLLAAGGFLFYRFFQH